MHTQRQIDYLQAQRASEWLEILKGGREEDLAAFRKWCRKSPLHIQEFLEITCTDRALGELDFGPEDRKEDLIALLREISGGSRDLPAQSLVDSAAATAPRPRRSHRWPWALAAAVATLTVGAAYLMQSWFHTQEFSTRIGEQRTVELRDRSIITMNTDSTLEVQFDQDAREVELRHGEAVFKVTRDPARPFRVRTRAGVVQAVGTEFNVYDRPEGTDVAVLEGRVRLMPHAQRGSGSGVEQELVAGEEARIALDGSIRRATQPDVARVTAWSKRRLKFHKEPLEEMVREFNRYHRDVRLRLEGIPAGSHHYSGIFDADDPGTLARFLEREPDLRVERLEHEIVIRHRVPADSHTD